MRNTDPEAGRLDGARPADRRPSREGPQTLPGFPDRTGHERSFLSLIPWRNFMRAAFLILALLAVVALKRSGGGFFKRLLDGVAPPVAAPTVETTVHMRAGPDRR